VPACQLLPLILIRSLYLSRFFCPMLLTLQVELADAQGGQVQGTFWREAADK
jgi:hypothetical protein